MSQAESAFYQAAENGDIETIGKLIAIYETKVEPTKKDWRRWLVAKSFWVDSIRHERFSQQFSQIVSPLPLREMREQALSTANIESTAPPDVALFNALCKHCGFDNFQCTFFPNSQHDNTYDFVCKGLLVAQVAAQRDSDRCQKCKSGVKPVFIDYHTRSSASRDLVFRCYFNGTGAYKMTYGLLWWHGSGNYTVIDSTEIPSGEPVEAMVKRALRLLQDEERAWAQAVIRKAMQLYPAYKSFLELARFFDREQERSFVESILLAHLAAYPDDLRAKSMMADLLMDASCC